MLYSRLIGIPVVTTAMSLYACFLCLTFSVLIGASVSKPHTSDKSWDFLYIMVVRMFFGKFYFNVNNLLVQHVNYSATTWRYRLAAETTEEREARLQPAEKYPWKQKNDSWNRSERKVTAEKYPWMRRMAAETSEEKDCSRWVPFSTKGWQLKLLLKETPDCSKWETDWQLRPPKKRCEVGGSVTGKDTGNYRLFSHSFLCFNSVPSKQRYVNFMQTGLHTLLVTHVMHFISININESNNATWSFM